MSGSRVNFHQLVELLSRRQFFKIKDIELLREKLANLDESLDAYVFAHPSASTAVEKGFIKAGQDMRSSVVDLLKDDNFLKALKDDTFRSKFFLTLDSFAKLAADPTKIDDKDANVFHDLEVETVKIKSSFWASKSNCFVAFLLIASVLAAAAVITAVVMTGGAAIIPAIAMVAVAYTQTAGIALGATVTANSTAAIATGVAVTTAAGVSKFVSSTLKESSPDNETAAGAKDRLTSVLNEYTSKYKDRLKDIKHNPAVREDSSNEVTANRGPKYP